MPKYGQYFDYSMVDINDLIVMLWKLMLLNYEIIFISVIIIFWYLAQIP